MKHIGDVGEYIFFSTIWIIGVFSVLFLGYFLGSLHGAYPDDVKSPFDDGVKYLNGYVFKYSEGYSTEYNTDARHKRILYIEIILTVISLILLEVGGRKVYVLLPKIREYKKEFWDRLRKGEDHNDQK